MSELEEINDKLKKILENNKEVTGSQIWKAGISEQVAGMEEKIDLIESALWGKERTNGIIGDVSAFKKLLFWVPVVVGGLVAALKFLGLIPK